MGAIEVPWLYGHYSRKLSVMLKKSKCIMLLDVWLILAIHNLLLPGLMANFCSGVCRREI